jgi:hypothetical protein
MYKYNTTDPWFSANTLTGIGSVDDNTATYYQDSLMTGIGCADTYQMCNPNTQGTAGDSAGCTPVGSFKNLQSEYMRIGLNNYQIATAQEIISALFFSNMFGAVDGRGPLALQAQDTVFSSVLFMQEGKLPENQWQIELDGWFEASLARFQQDLVEDAAGLPKAAERSDGTFTPPADKWGEAVCKRQMIRNAAGYQNFSTLGVVLIVILGSILIFLGSCVDTIVGWVQERMKANYSRLSWTSDGYLQLHRMAWEEAGFIGWKGCDGDVPTYKALKEDDQMLGDLDIREVDHPNFSRAQESLYSPESRLIPQGSHETWIIPARDASH